MFVDDISDAIGHIRRAIVRAKRHLRGIKEDSESMSNEKATHTKNIEMLTNLINEKNVTSHQLSIIVEIYQAIKISNDEELGLDLLDTLETVKFE